ncbi:MAG: hypothetical protein EXR72_02405, partial [Myxococcales bacterium]|nr:hypothetical protein [Myxococcales bacterium]
MRPLKASSFLLPLLFAAGCGTSPPNMAAPPDLVAPLPPDLSVPGCSDDKSCKDPTPHCDPKSGKCLACTADDHCPPGLLCANGTCAAGCSASHECGDAGVCDRDAGVCRSCMTDAECGDPANPCCDVPARKCVPCLPANDNCPAEKYCAQTNGVYACLPGCGDDGDCQGGPGPDAGVLGSPACCNHVCVDTSSDNAHCKTCGNACGMGKTCCAQACVDTAIDANHCGGCGKVCTLPNSGVPACAAAKCVIAKCKDGTADCDNDPKNGCEVNTDTDPLNCLGCGNTCVVGHGKAGCAMQCTIASCDNGFADCDKSFPNGCEIDITTTVSDCGGCAMACPMVPGATSGCALGACTIASCIGAAEDCNMTAKDGCEVDTSIDVKNCGGCAKNCPAVVQGTPGCAEGVCGIASCQPSFKDCNNNPADGCEVDSRIDVSNCGACGKVCAGVAQGVAGCAASACVIASCNAGYKDCNDNLNDGCEVGTNTDVKNCGACGKVCPAVPNGSPICTLGVCGATGCNLPYKDCDNNPANGCEVNTATDPKHCGLCNAVCPNVLNGTPGCAAGKCGIGVCNASFQDCNMNPADGCEINTTTDANNCNGCGKKCMLANATAGCANSACTVAACAA